jgi:catechol 2,3-dioxygenase-like lactoylglutathione lyase family enzyme
MLESCELIAFVSATDLDRARAFYEGVLGLPVTEHTDFACVFVSGGTMLRVTAAPTVAQPGYTVLGWRVADITGVVRELTAKNVRFLRFDGMQQDEDGIWATPAGDRIAWFADPDGNTLSLTQFH